MSLETPREQEVSFRDQEILTLEGFENKNAAEVLRLVTRRILENASEG